MDEQTEEPGPPGDGPAENPLAAKEPHRIPGRFLPGVMPPVGRQWKPGESGNPAGYSKAG